MVTRDEIAAQTLNAELQTLPKPLSTEAESQAPPKSIIINPKPNEPDLAQAEAVFAYYKHQRPRHCPIRLSICPVHREPCCELLR